MKRFFEEESELKRLKNRNKTQDIDIIKDGLEALKCKMNLKRLRETNTETQPRVTSVTRLPLSRK